MIADPQDHDAREAAARAIDLAAEALRSGRLRDAAGYIETAASLQPALARAQQSVEVPEELQQLYDKMETARADYEARPAVLTDLVRHEARIAFDRAAVNFVRALVTRSFAPSEEGAQPETEVMPLDPRPSQASSEESGLVAGRPDEVRAQGGHDLTLTDAAVEAISREVDPWAWGLDPPDVSSAGARSRSMADVRRYVTAALPHLQPSGWRPSETIPRDGTWVLAAIRVSPRANGSALPVHAIRRVGRGAWQSMIAGRHIIENEILAWRPFPSSPEAASEERGDG